MFKTSVSSTAFTSEAANEYFEQSIPLRAYGADVSFTSTLRALLGQRMGDNDHVYLYFGSKFYHDVEYEDRDALCRDVVDFGIGDGSLAVVNIRSAGDPENSNYVFAAIEERFSKVFDQWHCLEKVTQFYRKSFRVLCFINPDCKGVVLFVEDMTTQKMHFLQCGVLAYLPWFFNVEEGVSEAEMALIQSLRSRNADDYLAAINPMAEIYDFQTGRLKRLLNGFESRYEQRRLETIKRDIQSTDNDIDSYNGYIREALLKRRDLCITLLGLETKLAQQDGESEILDYFLHNKHLYLESTADNTLYFAVRDYLAYFDEDGVNKMLKNKTSYVYRRGGSAISKDDMAMYVKAVFLDEKLKIRTCAAYSLTIGGNVDPQRNHMFPDGFETYLPNAHVDRYHCMGNYVQAVNSLLRNNDYIGAIEQCIASAKSLNFFDSPVMEYFFDRLYSNSGKFTELPDGRVVTVVDAIEWLKEQEAPIETEQETEG